MQHIPNGRPVSLKVFDRVSVDGRRGTALGVYPGDEQTILVRLDASGLIEVEESRIAIENPWVTSGWSDERRGDESAGRARHEALTQALRRPGSGRRPR